MFSLCLVYLLIYLYQTVLNISKTMFTLFSLCNNVYICPIIHFPELLWPLTSPLLDP